LTAGCLSFKTDLDKLLRNPEELESSQWEDEPVGVNEFFQTFLNCNLSVIQLEFLEAAFGKHPKVWDKKFRELLAFWGMGCLSGDSIIVDEETHQKYTVQELMIQKKEITAKCYDEKNHQDVLSKIGVPFIKGVDELYEVTLETGQKIRVTKEHKFLTRDGWKELKDIKEGEEIISQDSIVCQECGKDFTHLTGTHLKLHNMTMAEYKAKNPLQNISSKEHRQKCGMFNIGEKHPMHGKHWSKETNLKNRISNSKSFEERYGERAEEMKKKCAVHGSRNPWNRPEVQKAIVEKKRASGFYERWSAHMKAIGGYATKVWQRYVYNSNHAGKVTVVGTYELRMCKLLDKMLELKLIIKWEYTNDKIHYEMKQKQRFYTPDFKVWTEKDNWFYIDTKGWMTEECKEKMDIVSKQAPIKIIFGQDLDKLEKEYEHAVQ